MNVPKISFLLTHFSSFRKQKGILLTDFAKMLTHFSSFRKQKAKLLSQLANLLTHFSNFRKQKAKLLSQLDISEKSQSFALTSL